MVNKVKMQRKLLGKTDQGKPIMVTLELSGICESMPRFSAVASIDGKTDTEMMRLEEGGESPPCDRCAPMDGLIMTYAEFVSSGKTPGGSTCLGGDFCLGILIPLR